MSMKLENTEIIYHQDADQICIALEKKDGSGLLIHPVTQSGLMSFVAWGSARWAYEPLPYRVVMGIWYRFKALVLRRPVRMGNYSREITGRTGYIKVTVEHFEQTVEPLRIPFLRRIIK